MLVIGDRLIVFNFPIISVFESTQLYDQVFGIFGDVELLQR